MKEQKYYQKTIREPVSFVGIGLHSGKPSAITIRPSVDNGGIYFLRKRVGPGGGLIPARWHNVHTSEMSTVLSNSQGVSVATVEHLMAAFSACGIDNAIVEVDGPEVPIMDGSAEPFTAIFERVGTQIQSSRRRAICIEETIEVRDGDKFAMLIPNPTPRITLSIDFPDSVIGSQTYSVALDGESFRKEIASARTFGFQQQVQALRRRGLALGGSLNNAILIEDGRVINPGGLRYANECVRHKILDAYGDMALAGMPIIGHYYGHKPGHALNQALLQQLFTGTTRWSYVDLGAFQRLIERQEQRRVDLTQQPFGAGQPIALSNK